MTRLILSSFSKILFLSLLFFGVVVVAFAQINSKNMTSSLSINMADAYKQAYQNQNNLDLTLKPNFTPVKKFTPSIKLNHYQALAYHKSSLSKSKLLRTILNNSERRRKFKYVMKKATELKLPHELALIPVIESEYKNRAVSSAGAAGPWQLMSGTARLFGLSNQQRFEMAASTKAALLHLKYLYKEYGNWELAIAAYNAGDGRVNKALNRNPHAKTVQDLNLPHETRQYVLAFFQLQNALKKYDLT